MRMCFQLNLMILGYRSHSFSYPVHSEHSYKGRPSCYEHTSTIVSDPKVDTLHILASLPGMDASLQPTPPCINKYPAKNILIQALLQTCWEFLGALYLGAEILSPGTVISALPRLARSYFSLPFFQKNMRAPISHSKSFANLTC